MKIFIVFIALTGLILACGNNQQGNKKPEKDSIVSALKVENAYDSVYAKKLGADEYGMKQYVMAFLKRGPNRNQDSAAAEQLQKAHLANITRMAEEGKLVIAGPFLDDFEVRGIYIFNVETIKEAEELTKTDPAIKSGRLVMELHPWYGSAGLIEVNALHKKVAKKGF